MTNDDLTQNGVAVVGHANPAHRVHHPAAKSTDLDHRLGGRMLDDDLTQNGVAVVGHANSAHRVHQHLQHGPGTETCSNDTGDGLGGGDVAELDFLPLLSFCVAV